MTAVIDLWVIATILCKLRDSGLITQREAEKILERVPVQTGAKLVVDI